MQMRIRGFEIDLMVVLMAAAVTVFGLVLGFGMWAAGAGALIVVAASGSGYLAEWLRRRFDLPPAGTRELVIVRRSLAAAATMRQLVRSVPEGPVSQRCREMERQARAGLPTIRALALQAFRVRHLAEGIPVDRLEQERAYTAGLIAGNPEERLRLELESSLRSTEAQLRTGQRLRGLAEELAARARALTTSMEAVAAGLAELQALSSSDPNAQPQIALASLSREIEALRGGLEEAQTFGRRAAAIHLLEV
jgi:hypothetical protein